MQATNTLQLTDQNFDSEVEQFSGVVMVDFWAVWCGPCHAMSPRVTELAEMFKGNDKVKVAQLNVDDAQETAERFHILSIPTFLFFAAGKQVDMMSGVKPTSELKNKIEQALQGA